MPLKYDISDFVGATAIAPGADHAAPALNTAGGDWTHAMQLAANYGADAYSNGFADLPLGAGYYNGTPLSNINVEIHGVSPAHTKLTAQTPIVNVPTVGTFGLSNLSIFGGTNPIQLGNATDNGGRMRCIDRVEFHGFSGSAVTVSGSDTPYMKYDRVTIDGAAGAIGFNFNGWLDCGSITRCDFRSYAAAIKCGAINAPQNIDISMNSFMHVGDPNAASNPHDLWYVPCTTDILPGQGLRFHNNRHGNETIQAATKRIVFADVGTDGLPKLTVASAGFVGGVTISDNDVYMGSDATPYIYTTTDNLEFNSFGWGCTLNAQAASVAQSAMLQSLSGQHTTKDKWNTNLIWDWRSPFHPQGTTTNPISNQNQNPTPAPVAAPVNPWWWWI